MIWIDVAAGATIVAILAFAFIGVIYLGFQMGRQSAGHPPARTLPPDAPKNKQPRPKEDPYIRAMKDPRKAEQRIKTIPEGDK